MKQYSATEYLRLSKMHRFWLSIGNFFASIPTWFASTFRKAWGGIKKAAIAIFNWIKDIITTFIHGDWKTRISYLIMGFGNVARGQVLRGLLFFTLQVAFIVYMCVCGGKYLSDFNSLGLDINQDNSFKILLYSILTLFFIAAFVYTWSLNVKQNRIAQRIELDEKKLETAKDDLRSLVDKNFNKTLLALPTIGIIVFTIMPIIFMILIAFTNYDGNHTGALPSKLFGWVGFDNWFTLFTWKSGDNAFSATFGEILVWTLIWAFFATFTNYFLGMVVAMLINKKGIKFKKLWRTILVFSIAIPQFISLLYVSQMFDFNYGFFNNVIEALGGTRIHFIDSDANPLIARITVIVINIWIGIPYLMLVTTGILMNIPADLYESANIDGANVWQQYTKITLPYMLFVTGPYLLTSFTGNMNNFNVIYLLTGGAPTTSTMAGLNAGKTDLLITWLFKMTIKDSQFYKGAVIGIIVFVVVAFISLLVYNILPSTKNEEEFQ